MREIEILYQNIEKIFENLSHGQVDAIEEAVEQITDEFMIYGLRGGLIDKLSKSFPDPRREVFGKVYPVVKTKKWGS